MERTCLVKQPSFTEGIGWYISGGGIVTHLVGKVRRNIDVRRYVPPHTFTGARSNGATVYKACSGLSWQIGIKQAQSATEGAPGRPHYESVGRGGGVKYVHSDTKCTYCALFLRRYRLCFVVIQSTDTSAVHYMGLLDFYPLQPDCVCNEPEMNLTIY